MKKEREDKVKDWLDKLQTDSWNLELLITGFSIFLLTQADPFITDKLIRPLQNQYDLPPNILSTIMPVLLSLKVASSLLIFALIVLIVLRGYWIGLIGLRSVQTDIRWDRLKMSDLFLQRMGIQLSGLEGKIHKLDKICSSLFAFSFLVILSYISFCLFLSYLPLVNYLLFQLQQNSSDAVVFAVRLVRIPVMLFFTIGGVLYLVDTLTVGMLIKRWKWPTRLFWPFYLAIGHLILAHWYRPLYYYLASMFGRLRMALIITPLFALIFFSPFMRFTRDYYFPDKTTEWHANINDYDDERPERDYIHTASIPSKIVEGAQLPLFIRYRPLLNEYLKNKCPDYKTGKNSVIVTGLQFKNNDIYVGNAERDEPDAEQLLKCITGIFQVKIDSVEYPVSDFMYYIHPNRSEKGITGILPIDSLTVGSHEITIRNFVTADSSELYARIWFWKTDK